MSKKTKEFRTRAQAAFRALLTKREIGYTQIKGCSLAGCYRLYNGEGAMTAKKIAKIAAFFGEDGKALLEAWLVDKAAEVGVKWKFTIVVE
jgi:hypothetical protein